MHAVVIYGKEDYRYEEVPEPRPGEEEVVVRIGRCGICATDIKLFRGKVYFSQDVYRNAPIIAGHEFIGEVVKLGPGARERYGLELGDKAIMEQIIPCKDCYYCRRGLYHLCDAKKFTGEIGINGGWAEYMLYPKGAIIHKVPKEMPWEKAVLVEPLACAIHGVRLARINLEDVVLLIGAGSIGLLMLQVIKLMNPKLIIVSEPLDYRLRKAKELGADIVINPFKEDLVERIMEETDGAGCDVALETAGAPKAVEDAVKVLRKRGRLLIFGIYEKNVSLDLNIVGEAKELEIRGSSLAPNTYPIAINLLHKGLIREDVVVTHNFPLKEWRRAIEVAEKRLEGAIKVTMTPLKEDTFL